MMMNRHVPGISSGLFLLLVLFFCSDVPSRAQAPAARLENPLNAINWLIGTWTAVEQGPDGLAVTIQLNAEWIDNGNAIQVISTRIPAGGSPAVEYRATFRWDPQKKQIVMTRTDSNGDRFEGVVLPAGDDFSLAGRLTRANGSTEQLRYSYNSWTPGTFALETTSQEQKLLDTTVNPSLVFLRQKAAPNSGETAGMDQESSSGAADSPNPPKARSIPGQ